MMINTENRFVLSTNTNVGVGIYSTQYIYIYFIHVENFSYLIIIILVLYCYEIIKSNTRNIMCGYKPISAKPRDNGIKINIYLSSKHQISTDLLKNRLENGTQCPI